MGILLEVPFFLFLVQITSAATDCPIFMCRRDSIPIRFPFQLGGQQSQNCSYPGFNLGCNSQSLTSLNLPHSGKFLVRDINYLTQEIQIYDPDNCLPNRLLQNFNLSGSPFFVSAYQNYTFLSCPTQLLRSRFATIDCLSNSTTSVLATSSISLLGSMANYCQKIVTLPIPVSWPAQYYEGFTTELDDDLLLTWLSPDCGECEAQGGTCGFQGNAGTKVGCYYNPETGRSSGVRHALKVICVSIGIPFVACGIIIVIFGYWMDKRSRRHLQTSTAEIQSTAATITPQPTITATGLDESTIQSYQKLVIDGSRRLPGQNDSRCAICLSEYQEKETVKWIPDCNHCFHADCIDEWLRRNCTCPICRNSPSSAHDRLDGGV